MAASFTSPYKDKEAIKRYKDTTSVYPISPNVYGPNAKPHGNQFRFKEKDPRSFSQKFTDRTNEIRQALGIPKGGFNSQRKPIGPIKQGPEVPTTLSQPPNQIQDKTNKSGEINRQPGAQRANEFDAGKQQAAPTPAYTAGGKGMDIDMARDNPDLVNQTPQPVTVNGKTIYVNKGVPEEEYGKGIYSDTERGATQAGFDADYAAAGGQDVARQSAGPGGTQLTAPPGQGTVTAQPGNVIPGLSDTEKQRLRHIYMRDGKFKNALGLASTPEEMQEVLNAEKRRRLERQLTSPSGHMTLTQAAAAAGKNKRIQQQLAGLDAREANQQNADAAAAAAQVEQANADRQYELDVQKQQVDTLKTIADIEANDKLSPSDKVEAYSTIIEDPTADPAEVEAARMALSQLVSGGGGQATQAASGGTGESRAKAVTETGRNIPKKGEVVYGYRFKGGDPNSADGWEKA